MAIKFFAFFFPTISTFGCFWSQWPNKPTILVGYPHLWKPLFMDFGRSPLWTTQWICVSLGLWSQKSLPVIRCKASDFEHDLKGLYGDGSKPIIVIGESTSMSQLFQGTVWVPGFWPTTISPVAPLATPIKGKGLLQASQGLGKPQQQPPWICLPRTPRIARRFWCPINPPVKSPRVFEECRSFVPDIHCLIYVEQ